MKLGSQGLEVAALGLGCMGMSAYYGPPKPEPDMVALIHHAVAAGVTLLDTSDIYGPHTNELLLGKALQGEVRGKVQLATKFGILAGADGARATRRTCAQRARAASGASAWNASTSTTSTASTSACPSRSRELDIGIVTYSPLCRGFFSSGPKLVDMLSEQDFRKDLPRFQAENLEKNTMVFERGNDVCPILGTTKVDNFNQNVAALSVKLAPEEMAELESYASADVAGDRYHDFLNTWKDSETPLMSSWKAK
ncbi:hypothetical protein VPH35_099158 [Triticum aestivum]